MRVGLSFLARLQPGLPIMLAKLTFGNRLTLPSALISAVEGAEYFDATEENGRIVLTPMRANRADAVRAGLAGRGLAETDIADAVTWARRTG